MYHQLFSISLLALLIILFNFQVFAHDLPNVIHISKNGFEPNELAINIGDKVTFENTDSQDHWPASNLHPTHSIYPEFDPKKPIKPGESWEFKFDRAGQWRMHDHLYPQMAGKIIVREAEESKDRPPFLSLWNRIVNFISGLASSSTSRSGFFKKEPAINYKFNQAIQTDAQTIFQNTDDLYSYIKKFGPKETTKRLHQLVPQFGDCHQKAHEAGRLAYEIYGASSFQKCSAECHSGCYHGATEAYFREHGTKNLTKDLNTICTGELNGFFSHQCIHGVGHGLMTYTDYELNEALHSCDLLDRMQNSCWTGVFMENFVGGVTEDDATRSGRLTDRHITKYLNNDPQYPCNIVDDKYKSSCYFLQSSRMMQLFYGNFEKIADECSKVPAIYHRVCFESMGRDVSGANRGSNEAAIKSCEYAPKGEMRKGCLIGAVQDRFWDPTGQDQSIDFCKMLSDKEEKEACYITIFSRAPDIFTQDNDIEAFCQKAEENYQSSCISYVR